MRSEISQGDIFDKLPVARVKYPESLPILKEIRGMLITRDCEFDKKGSIYVMVTEVRLLKEVNNDSKRNIRDRKTVNTFFIPAEEGFEEAYLDFRRTYQLEKAFLFDRKDKGFRLKSLDNEARLALQRQLAIFFGYKRTLVPAVPVL